MKQKLNQLEVEHEQTCSGVRDLLLFFHQEGRMGHREQTQGGPTAPF